MRQQEARTLIDVLHAVLMWERERKVGKIQINVLFVTDPPSLVLTLLVPHFTFTPQEAEFFARDYQLYSLNGTTPPSMAPLRDATSMLAKLGGRILIIRINEDVLSLQVTVPVNVKDPADLPAKLRLMKREFRGLAP